MSHAPGVRTRAGTVHGSLADGTRRFLGIPFAAPPVGALRFAPPAPALPWQGVHDTGGFGGLLVMIYDFSSEEQQWEESLNRLVEDVPTHFS